MASYGKLHRFVGVETELEVMKTSDQVVNCEVCQRYAIGVDPENWRDLFNGAWLNIREKEIREPMWEAKHYKSYFYRVLINLKAEEIRKENKRKGVEFYRLSDQREDEFKDEGSEEDVWEIEMEILQKWLERREKNEFQRFLQNIIELVLRCGSVEDGARYVEREKVMSRRSFYKYLKEAKNDVDYEYYLSVYGHPFDIVGVV